MVTTMRQHIVLILLWLVRSAQSAQYYRIRDKPRCQGIIDIVDFSLTNGTDLEATVYSDSGFQNDNVYITVNICVSGASLCKTAVNEEAVRICSDDNDDDEQQNRIRVQYSQQQNNNACGGAGNYKIQARLSATTSSAAKDSSSPLWTWFSSPDVMNATVIIQDYQEDDSSPSAVCFATLFTSNFPRSHVYIAAALAELAIVGCMAYYYWGNSSKRYICTACECMLIDDVDDDEKEDLETNFEPMKGEFT